MMDSYSHLVLEGNHQGEGWWGTALHPSRYGMPGDPTCERFKHGAGRAEIDQILKTNGKGRGLGVTSISLTVKARLQRQEGSLGRR